MIMADVLQNVDCVPSTEKGLRVSYPGCGLAFSPILQTREPQYKEVLPRSRSSR